MKRYFITAFLLGASALISCRNLTAVSGADTDPVNILHCAQEAESDCAAQPATNSTVDITSPLGIFLMN